jgi:hypothetical protein
MDTVFQPAMEVARSGDVERFVAIRDAAPALATAKSSVSHPTLLQFLVLEAVGAPTAPAMALVEEARTFTDR